MSSLIKPIWKGLIDLIYPPRCWICEKLCQDHFCCECQSAFLVIRSPLCLKCGKPCASEVPSCRECQAKNYRFTSARAYGLYEGGLKEAIHKFKYKRGKVLASKFAEMLVEAVGPQILAIDIVTFVPLTRRKARQREYNQAALLAQEVAKMIDKPCYSLLNQSRRTKDQSKLNFKERKKNVKGAFSVNKQGSLKNQAVLLVDDVFTTGATVNECSKVLLKAGAKLVNVATIARATKTV